MRMTPDEMIQATKGKIINRGRARVIRGVSVDSRTLKAGDLFFAFKGVRHDGHDYVSQALQKGACGIVGAESRLAGLSKGTGGWLVSVADPLVALGNTARCWRDRFSIPVIGVTGSNGKTTCKDMIATVLASRFRVHRTEGNFNNLVGVPLTLFRLNADQQRAVVEMGMNHLGEIARLCEIARPTAAVITNVGRAHLEGLESPTMIAQAKGELLEGAERGGPVFLNADDTATAMLVSKAHGPVTRFGFGDSSDIRCEEVLQESVDGCRIKGRSGRNSFELKLPLAGRHNISNALAALAVGAHFGVSLSEGIKALSKFQGAALRSEILRLADDRILFVDCYNANPDSMEVALQTVAQIANQRPILAVLGDMLEMGAEAARLHHELGRQAAVHGVQTLVAVGRWGQEMSEAFRKAGGDRAYVVADAAEASRQAVQLAKPSQLILVKGSRGVGLEAVVATLKGRYSN